MTALTVWAAYYEIGGLFVAMGIATAKAAVVTLMFMHLQYESKIIWGIVIYPIFIFILILAGTLGDTAVKQVPVPSGHYLKSQRELKQANTEEVTLPEKRDAVQSKH